MKASQVIASESHRIHLLSHRMQNTLAQQATRHSVYAQCLMTPSSLSCLALAMCSVLELLTAWFSLVFIQKLSLSTPSLPPLP